MVAVVGQQVISGKRVPDGFDCRIEVCHCTLPQRFKDTLIEVIGLTPICRPHLITLITSNVTLGQAFTSRRQAFYI